MPYATAWDEAGEFPRELYAKAAEIGLIGLGFPEEFGGLPSDPFMSIVSTQELARPGAGGVPASLMVHGIGAPPIAAVGSPELKARILPPVLRGEKIIALGITEPGGGSDVANLRTTARRDGNHYVVNGEKCYITGGMRADYLTTAVRTGGPGAGGVSLLVIETDRPGVTRTKLQKMGWWASDTAAIYFQDVLVPAENLVGAEGRGFPAIMLNFNNERLALAAGAIAYARVGDAGSHRVGAEPPDVRQAAGGSSGNPPQDRRNGPPGECQSGVPRNDRMAHGAGPVTGSRYLSAESAGNANDGILCAGSTADSGRRRVHARHEIGTHLSRGARQRHRRR